MLVDNSNEYTIPLNSSMDSAMLKFVVADDLETANISLSSTCVDDCRIAANVVTKEVLTGMLMNTSELTLSFKPYTTAFHYLTLRLLSGNATNVTVAMPDDTTINNRLALNKIPLTRKSLPDFFLFDYENLLANSSKPSPVNITIDSLTVLSFQVGAVYDVGGTVSVGLKLLNKSDDIVVIGCISLGM